VNVLLRAGDGRRHRPRAAHGGQRGGGPDDADDAAIRVEVAEPAAILEYRTWLLIGVGGGDMSLDRRPRVLGVVGGPRGRPRLLPTPESRRSTRHERTPLAECELIYKKNGASSHSLTTIAVSDPAQRLRI